MAATTTRIALKDNERLERLARQTGESKTRIIGRALEVLEREILLDAINDGFGALQRDAKAWDAELKERAAWDTTTGDSSRG